MVRPYDYRAVREAAGISQIKVSVDTCTSPPTVRVFEAGGPGAIHNPVKRQALVAAYDRMAESVAAKERRAA